MFDIKTARLRSSLFSLKQIKDEIDSRIDFESDRGGYSAAFVIYSYNITKYETYQKVCKEYVEAGYKVSYGKNHNSDYLITISWKED